MVWACMVLSGTGCLLLIDDVAADKKQTRTISVVCSAILSAHIQSNDHKANQDAMFCNGQVGHLT